MGFEKKQEQQSNKRFMALGIILLLIFLIRGFVLEISFFGDTSMAPTLIDNEYVLVNRLAYISSNPLPGDIVSVRLTERSVQHPLITVKRLIAVANQTVEIKNGQLIIDGKTMSEPYLVNQTFETYGPVTVPDNYFFILGDNRSYSTDSRSPEVGFISFDAIRGKVFFVIWPLKSVRSL